jgi:hypothetical protein
MSLIRTHRTGCLVTVSMHLRLLVCIAIVAFSMQAFAGLAAADDMGDSAPTPVPQAEVVRAETPTLDDRVGSFLHNAGEGLEKAGAGAVDILFLRTMGTAATAVGFGFFVCSAPFFGMAIWTVPDGFRESWDIFVVAPVEYTFERPLGQF